MSASSLLVRHIGRLTTWHGPVISDAALLARDGHVVWTGPDRAVPADAGDVPELDVAGAAVLPGFVDCHTHLVWAGSRRDDFCGRVQGGGYTPGGIAATVAATRAASYDDLRALTQARVDRAVAGGTTTIEVKSGYGLTPEHELRLLDVAAGLTGPAVTTTYLGAHVVPDGRDRADYVDEVVEGEARNMPFAVAEPTDARRQSLSLHLVSREADPSLQRVVVRECLEYGLVGGSEIGRISGQASPSERTGSAREERTDVSDDEARVAERVSHTGVAGLASQPVAVVEDNRARGL